MHLATLLSARALTRIRTAAGREHQVVVADDWTDLARVVRRLPIALAIVDPRPGGRVAAGELRELRHAFPSLPVLLHVAPSAPAMQDLVELAREGFYRVVIEGYEDDPGHVREQLAALVTFELEERVLGMLDPVLRAGPVGIGRAVSRLFLAPHEFGSVEDLARAAAMPRRTFDRWLRTLGLAPAHTLLVGARFLRAYQYVRDPGYELADVARKVGYSDPVLLTRQVRAVTGELPSLWRRHATEDATVDRLRTLLLAGTSPEGQIAARPPDATAGAA